jgi:hypothetical protein
MYLLSTILNIFLLHAFKLNYIFEQFKDLESLINTTMKSAAVFYIKSIMALEQAMKKK